MGINKALVVDDSRLARVALSKLLMRRGMEVDTAECGNDALRYLSEASPDVVFLDYMMPDMDGFQAAEAINRLRGERAVPLVMYTSQDTPEDRQRAQGLGICGFLSKPTSDDRLDTVLEQVMEWQLSRAPLQQAPARQPEPEPALAETPSPSAPQMHTAAEPAPAPTPDLFSRPEEQEILLPPHSAYVVEPEPLPLQDEPPAPAQQQPVAAQRAPSPPAYQPPPEPTLTAEQVRGIAEQVSREFQAENDQRWLQHMEQGDRRWEQRLRSFGEELQEAATEAATLAGQQAAQYAGREAMELVREEVQRAGGDAHEAARSAAEQAARGVAEDVARRIVQEQADQIARDVAGELAERATTQAAQEAQQTALQVAQQAAQQVARQVSQHVAQQVAEQLIAQSLERDQGNPEEIEGQVREVLDVAVRDLARQPVFHEQVNAAIGEFVVPLLKNRLQNWVMDQARETAVEAVDQAVERRLRVLVQEAVVASAEAAAKEADALHRRWRMVTIAGAAVLGLGVLLALAIAV